MSCSHPTVCHIIPPHILKHLAEKAPEATRKAALSTLETSAGMRAHREAVGIIAAVLATPTGERRRAIYDMQHKTRPLPGVLTRGEVDRRRSSDVSVNRAYDGLGATYDFYKS